MPTPDDLSRLDPDELLTTVNGFDIRPLPGGCLLSFGPRRDRGGF